MRKLSANIFVSLDGVMQAPGGPAEDPTGRFTLGGWNVTFWDDVMGAAMAEGFGEEFELLLGRKTYEIFAAHWPYISNDPVADRLNSVQKLVASRTLDVDVPAPPTRRRARSRWPPTCTRGSVGRIRPDRITGTSLRQRRSKRRVASGVPPRDTRPERDVSVGSNAHAEALPLLLTMRELAQTRRHVTEVRCQRAARGCASPVRRPRRSSAPSSSGARLEHGVDETGGHRVEAWLPWPT